MNKRFISFLFLCFLFPGCRVLEGSSHQPFMDKIQEATSQTPSGNLSSEQYLLGTEYIEVKEFDTNSPFYVAKRTPYIKRSNCLECHVKPLDQLLKNKTYTKKMTHWEIKLEHAGPDVMSCMTCHEENHMGSLHTIHDTLVDFNHSYQVCFGCHAKQAQDWSRGAHGKRLGGWAPPRVINNCTACHNPHQPRFEKRWPARASRLPTHPN